MHLHTTCKTIAKQIKAQTNVIFFHRDSFKSLHSFPVQYFHQLFMDGISPRGALLVKHIAITIANQSKTVATLVCTDFVVWLDPYLLKNGTNPLQSISNIIHHFKDGTSTVGGKTRLLARYTGAQTATEWRDARVTDGFRHEHSVIWKRPCLG